MLWTYSHRSAHSPLVRRSTSQLWRFCHKRLCKIGGNDCAWQRIRTEYHIPTKACALLSPHTTHTHTYGRMGSVHSQEKSHPVERWLAGNLNLLVNFFFVFTSGPVWSKSELLFRNRQDFKKVVRLLRSLPPETLDELQQSVVRWWYDYNKLLQLRIASTIHTTMQRKQHSEWTCVITAS